LKSGAIVAKLSTLAVITFKLCRVKWNGFAYITWHIEFSGLDERWRQAPALRYPGAIALRYALHAEALTMASVLGGELVCSSYNPASHKRRQA
jgi:hypothetical protein